MEVEPTLTIGYHGAVAVTLIRKWPAIELKNFVKAVTGSRESRGIVLTVPVVGTTFAVLVYWRRASN